jgi:rhodanese-related sulfurtransferase
MTFFGPISSLFDFATFAILLWVFDADATLFRSGWFVESLATQSLAIFAIRTRRVPFFRSRPSRPLLVSTLVCVTIGVLLPFSPLADTLGFTSLPAGLVVVLAAMIPLYLLLLELGKRRFYRREAAGQPLARPRPPRQRRIYHRASRWSILRLPRITAPRRAPERLPQPGEATPLDVRQEIEWKHGHIRSALHIPLAHVSHRAHELPSDTTIVTVCRSGHRSALAARTLRRAGYQVANLRGGMRAWAQAGRPLDPPSGKVL